MTERQKCNNNIVVKENGCCCCCIVEFGAWTVPIYWYDGRKEYISFLLIFFCWKKTKKEIKKLPEVRHVLSVKQLLLWIFLNLYQLYHQPANMKKIKIKPTIYHNIFTTFYVPYILKMDIFPPVLVIYIWIAVN